MCFFFSAGFTGQALEFGDTGYEYPTDTLRKNVKSRLKTVDIGPHRIPQILMLHVSRDLSVALALLFLVATTALVPLPSVPFPSPEPRGRWTQLSRAFLRCLERFHCGRPTARS